MIVGLSLFLSGCQQTQQSNANTAETAPQAAPDNSEVTTTTDSSGTRTETRTFRDNPRVSKVVVTTTKEGQRTVKVYSKNGEVRDLKSETGDVLKASGNAIADGAGIAADKTEDAYGKAKEGAGTVADKTKAGATTVADKTADTAKSVAHETKDVSKTVAKKTVNAAGTVADKTKTGVKKTGSTIKKIVTP